MNVNSIREMGDDEFAELKDAIRKVSKARPYKPPGMRIVGYLPNSYKQYLEPCIDYAYEQGYIKKKSPFSFTSWAVKQMITTIIHEIQKNAQEQRISNNHS